MIQPSMHAHKCDISERLFSLSIPLHVQLVVENSPLHAGFVTASLWTGMGQTTQDSYVCPLTIAIQTKCY